MRKTRKNFSGYAGDEYRLAICDLCGTKRHIKDMKVIDALFNRTNGAFICKEHHRPTHPQDIPFTIQPDIVTTPETIRTRQFPVRMQSIANNNHLPSAPQQLKATKSTIGNHIQLTWLRPANTGSSPILGYLVEFSVPQFTIYDVLIANTGTSVPSYLDIVNPSSTFLSYRVAAVTAIGNSPFSNEYAYPYIENISAVYIEGDDSFVIQGDDGYYLEQG